MPKPVYRIAMNPTPNKTTNTFQQIATNTGGDAPGLNDVIQVAVYAAAIPAIRFIPVSARSVSANR